MHRLPNRTQYPGVLEHCTYIRENSKGNKYLKLCIAFQGRNPLLELAFS